MSRHILVWLGALALSSAAMAAAMIPSALIISHAVDHQSEALSKLADRGACKCHHIGNPQGSPAGSAKGDEP